MAAVKEAVDVNLFSEFKALDVKYKNQNVFQYARWLLFGGIIDMLRFNPETGDMNADMTDDDNKHWEDINKRIKLAGQMLYASGGEVNMRDPLVWLFIPKRLHQDVDNQFNGIGNWRS
jgi:hypothetical protein